MALSEATTSMALIIVVAESGRPASKLSKRLCRWMTRGLGASEDAKASARVHRYNYQRSSACARELFLPKVSLA